MRFLGGLLKTIAVILLLAATAVCPAVAVMYSSADVYWVMGILWVVALFVTLTTWGAGHALTQLHKLNKRLEELEYRPIPIVHQEPAADGDFPEIVTAPRSSGKHTGRGHSGGAYAAPKSSGKWIWGIIIVVLVTATLAAALLLFHWKNSGSISAPDAALIPIESTEPAVSLDALGASAAIVKIKDNLKDPNSFELLSVERVPYLAMYIYRFEYTATNSFGGRLKNEAYVAVYIDTTKNTAKIHSKYEHYGLQDSFLVRCFGSGLDKLETIDIAMVEY